MAEQPNDVLEGIKVIVTFIKSNEIDLATHEINPAEAKVLKNNLITFADDWNSDKMSIYDNYDESKDTR